MGQVKVETLGLRPSFGFGDRLGLATPGHVAAMKRAGGAIEPIYAQQSIREMARTSRSPEQVMSDAVEGAAAAGWQGIMGADADHLKTHEDVDRTAAAGFVFFTIDPSGHVEEHADEYSLEQLRTRYAPLRDEVTWADRYLGKMIKLSTGTAIELDEPACLRAAVKYGRAIRAAIELGDYIGRVMAGREYEIELSVDETPQPTTLAEHYIIADQCLSHGMKLVSLAPRYIGDFEKGVDYKGDVPAFERSMKDHAAIAQLLGPYKLSLHSGSDKLSIYPAFARASEGMFHVKTAGTSYLEALRVVAHRDEALWRRVIDFSRGRYEHDKATYHVSATLKGVPAPAQVGDARELEQIYLERWDRVAPGKGFTQPGRQIVHTTFGSVLTDPTLGPAVRQVVKENQSLYTQLLEEHFARHLEALREGM